jgi:hypothetical protein
MCNGCNLIYIHQFQDRIKEVEGQVKDYIASQINSQGMDELQRLVPAYSLGFNIALDGPPAR